MNENGEQFMSLCGRLRLDIHHERLQIQKEQSPKEAQRPAAKLHRNQASNARQSRCV